jgi:hypothetical protein
MADRRLLELTPDQRAALGEERVRALEARTPKYECPWCAEDGDMRTDPTTLKLVMVASDPDLHPGGGVLWTDLHHARCRPPELAYAERSNIDLPASPAELELTIDVEGVERSAGFEVDIVPLLPSEVEDLEDGEEQPEAALLLDARCVNDQGGGRQAWAFTWGIQFREAGFTPWSDGPGLAEGWALRIAPDGKPQWLAIRRTPDGAEPPEHLWLGQVELSDAWVRRARELGRVLLLTGPVGPRWELSGHEWADVHEDLADGALVWALVPLVEVATPVPAAAGG